MEQQGRQRPDTQVDNTISLDEAYALTGSDPDLHGLYLRHCDLYNWPERDLNCSPQWADWFARRVLLDQWPAAEGLIATDPVVDYGYRNFIWLLEQTGMKGYSTGSHEWARIRKSLEGGLAGAALQHGMIDDQEADRVSGAVDRFMRIRRRSILRADR